MPTAVLEQLRVLRNFSLAQRRQARPERFGESHAPNDKVERDAEIALDDHPGYFEARGDGKPAWSVLSHAQTIATRSPSGRPSRFSCVLMLGTASAPASRCFQPRHLGFAATASDFGPDVFNASPWVGDGNCHH